MPTLLNLVPNSAKVMATSGVAVIRLILRVSDCGTFVEFLACLKTLLYVFDL